MMNVIELARSSKSDFLSTLLYKRARSALLYNLEQIV